MEELKDMIADLEQRSAELKLRLQDMEVEYLGLKKEFDILEEAIRVKAMSADDAIDAAALYRNVVELLAQNAKERKICQDFLTLNYGFIEHLKNKQNRSEKTH